MVREIITTVERRRHWPDGEKLRILSEAVTPGAAIATVADRNGVCRSLLYTWLRLAREGRLGGIALSSPKAMPPGAVAPSFAPVTIAPEASIDPAPAQPFCAAPVDSARVLARRRIGTIEVRLVNGRSLKVDETIAPDVLARLVAALDGEPPQAAKR